MARGMVVGILALLVVAGGAGCSLLLDFGGELAADAAPADAGAADGGFSDAALPDAAPTTDAGS